MLLQMKLELFRAFAFSMLPLSITATASSLLIMQDEAK
jgi:hypothetical protein